MKIHLPNSAFLGNIDPFLRNFNPADPDRLEISSNPKWISIHPMVLSMIAAIGLTVDRSKIIFEKFEAKSKHYLQRMGLFSLLGIDSLMEIREHESAGRFIPLSRIKDSQRLTDFIKNMIPLLHVEPVHAEPIRYIISELARNVLEHSLSPCGAVLSAQYYKKSNTIRLGIADTGIGIKTSITRSHNAKDDIEAIRLALMPGVTGATTREGGTSQNAGAGLFFIKSIAHVNRDFFVIYSGNAIYKLLKKNSSTKRIKLNADPFNDRYSCGDDFPFWKGTLVGIDISLNETREFSILLDSITDTYSKAIRERRKTKYKKVRFT